jgi:hypothetical protein
MFLIPNRQPIPEDGMYASVPLINPSEIPIWMMRKEIFVFDYGVIGNSFLVSCLDSLLELFRVGRTSIF